MTGASACAVGRLGSDGPWVGFAPSSDHGYALAVGWADRTRRIATTPDDLVALAVAYFEESLDPPPDELAATHGDIGALLRRVAERERDSGRRRMLDESVDAVDDGLAADVALARLGRLLPDDTTAAAHLRRRVDELSAGEG